MVHGSFRDPDSFKIGHSQFVCIFTENHVLDVAGSLKHVDVIVIGIRMKHKKNIIMT
jgi:hypothetical protein